MIKRLKKGSVGVLALALCLSAFAFSDVNAANGIETDRECSITFELSGNTEGESAEFAELADLSIPVELYRVADVSVTGKYDALEGFLELGLDKVNSETTAAQWEEMAQKAADILDESEAKPTATVEMEDGKGTAENLQTGMYLVAAQEVLSEEYAYEFTPYLISLPNNYYATSGNDDWVYDVTTSLKPSREERFGSLIIDKTLTSYNATLGSATFVFQIEGTKDGEKVYSDVVSTVFDAAGTKSLTVGEIPAGTEVTVTEIYSGANYELTSAASQQRLIVADPEEETGANGVHVTFTNQYNGGLNGNASVVNHFTIDGEGRWHAEQQFSDAGAQE